MINRIVKMTFNKKDIDDFLRLYQNVKPKIEAQSGCHGVRLLQDTSYPTVLFTYSRWEDDASLQSYRQSELFIETWKKTKSLFAAKAEAWSTMEL